MKVLIILAVSLFSFNAFSAQAGSEDKKSPCGMTNLSGRTAKPIIDSTASTVEVEKPKAAGK